MNKPRREGLTGMLTDRERMIAERYAQGETYKQIARALYIAPATVRNHLATIYRKLGVSNKAALIATLANTSNDRPTLVQPEAESRSDAVLRILAQNELPPTAGPSIAVMPFAGASADVEQFGYGVSEDIHTNLTRFRDLFVSGRSSCRSMSEQTSDVREIARKLGVQYLLQGTVRSYGDTVRITAELVDGDTGGVLWSHQYDRVLKDIFTVESEVANTISTMLSLRIEDVHYERRRESSPDNLSAYDWTLRGNRRLDLGGMENLTRAIDDFEHALKLAPESATASAGLSMCYGYACWDLLADNYSRSLELHRELAERAIVLDEKNSKGHYAMSCAQQLAGQLELADLHAERAVELNPSEYHNLCARGYTLLWLGRTEESVACFEQSLRRNPLAPNSCLLAFGLFEYLEGNYAQSVLALSRLTGDHVRRFSCLAAAYSQLEYDDAARSAVREFRKIVAARPGCPSGDDPEQWQTFWRQTYPFMKREAFQHLLDGVVKAGLPA